MESKCCSSELLKSENIATFLVIFFIQQLFIHNLCESTDKVYKHKNRLIMNKMIVYCEIFWEENVEGDEK